jgi:hypothetical protein
MVLENRFLQATLVNNLRATNNQSSQLMTHYYSPSILPIKGTKYKQILFMKIHLLVHQRLNFNTVFQELRQKC